MDDEDAKLVLLRLKQIETMLAVSLSLQGAFMREWLPSAKLSETERARISNALSLLEKFEKQRREAPTAPPESD